MMPIMVAKNPKKEAGVLHLLSSGIFSCHCSTLIPVNASNRFRRNYIDITGDKKEAIAE